jgi:hypothetical protein
MIEMKINNNLNENKATLKEQAQRIYNSITKYTVLNDENLLYKIQGEILNKANQGERELNIYLRKMPKGYNGVHGFSIDSIVIDLDKYPTTTMREVCDELVGWLKTQGFLPQDIFLCISENQNEYEPIIGTVTVQW